MSKSQGRRSSVPRRSAQEGLGNFHSQQRLLMVAVNGLRSVNLEWSAESSARLLPLTALIFVFPYSSHPLQVPVTQVIVLAKSSEVSTFVQFAWDLPNKGTNTLQTGDLLSPGNMH